MRVRKFGLRLVNEKFGHGLGHVHENSLGRWVVMKEISFGVIPLRQEGGVWEVFLVQHVKGAYWAMPKGHKELLEAPLDTAKRELFEETGLTIESLIVEEPIFEHYEFTRDNQHIEKTVGYFIAKAHGKVVLQAKEIMAGKWVTLQKAIEMVTFSEAKDILHKVQMIIQII